MIVYLLYKANKCNNKIAPYSRYVDGTSKIAWFLFQHMNIIQTNIKFTLDEEQQNLIHILALTIQKNANKFILNVCRKAPQQIRPFIVRLIIRTIIGIQQFYNLLRPTRMDQTTYSSYQLPKVNKHMHKRNISHGSTGIQNTKYVFNEYGSKFNYILTNEW